MKKDEINMSWRRKADVNRNIFLDSRDFLRMTQGETKLKIKIPIVKCLISFFPNILFPQ